MFIFDMRARVYEFSHDVARPLTTVDFHQILSEVFFHCMKLVESYTRFVYFWSNQRIDPNYF